MDTTQLAHMTVGQLHEVLWTVFTVSALLLVIWGAVRSTK